MNEMENKSTEAISGDVDLLKLLLRLWEKRKRIVAITGSFILLGIIYAFLIATPMFRSITTLYPVGQEKGSNSQLQVLAAQFGVGGLVPSNSYNIPDIVRSRRIKKKILEKTWTTTKEPDKQIYLYDYWDIDGDNLLIKKEMAIEKLSELISVSKDDETELITISILTEDPQLSADIVNYIGFTVTKYIREAQQEQGMKNRMFIESRLIETKNDLSIAEEALKDFRERNRVITKTAELQLEYARLQRDITIKQEIYITLEKQKELAMIEETKDTPIVNVLDAGEKPIKKAKPKRLVILIIYMVIGLLIAIISCFVPNPFSYLKTKSASI